MKAKTKIKINKIIFILILLFYLLSHFLDLSSDYNIFDSGEIDFPPFSIFPILVKFISLFFSDYPQLFPQRLLSILAGLIFIFILRYYFSAKRLPNFLFLVLIFILNPYVFYYTRVGQPWMLASTLLFASFFLHSFHGKKFITLILFVLSVLICPQFLIFIISYYFLFTDSHITISESLLYFIISLFFLSFFVPFNLIILLLSFLLPILLSFILPPKNKLLLILILLFFLPFTRKAYQATIHNSLAKLNYRLKSLQKIYPSYQVFTTFNSRQLSQYFGQEIPYLVDDLESGAIIITDDINSLILDSKAKELAYQVFQKKVPPDTQVYSVANSYSYFPAKYDKNTYRIYLILSDHDYQSIFGSFQD